MSDGLSRRLPTINLPPIQLHNNNNLQTTTTAAILDIARPLPQLADNYHRSLHDALEALQNADAALTRAREAFSVTNMNIVDLTNPSSDASNGEDFISTTRHPDDRNTRFSAATHMDAPNLFDFLPRHRAENVNQQHPPRLPSVRDLLNPPASAFARRQEDRNAILNARGQEDRDRILDDHAVRRQAQARREWERVERRNLQRVGSQSQSESFIRQRQIRRSASNDGHIADLTSDSEDSASDVDVLNSKTTLDSILGKQQQATIASQNKSASTETGETVLSAYKCAICMESPTEATTTVCGHMFCRQCILDSLKWSEQARRGGIQFQPNKTINGRCPVCRTTASNKENTTTTRGRNTNGLVLLEFKKMSRSQFNKKKEQEKFFNQPDIKGKEKVRAIPDIDTASDSGRSMTSKTRKRKRSRELDALFED